MNRTNTAIDNQISQKDLDNATNLWNIMSQSERAPFVDAVPMKAIKTRNSSIMFVHIAKALKEAGKI